jgi:hypothetical protein
MNGTAPTTLGVPDGAPGYTATLVGAGVLFLAATGWFVYALLSNPSPEAWGYLVANFLYVLGVSQFGISFCAVMRLVGAKWGRTFYPVAAMITLAFCPFAILGFLFIYAFGSEQILYWLSAPEDAHLSAWLDSDLLLLRNLGAQLLFYGVSIYYAALGLAPEIPKGEEDKGPGWRQSVLRWILSSRLGRDDATIEDRLYRWSPIVLICAVLANTFIAWDFSMMLVPHYHSTVFPMYFILGNMYGGAGLILIVSIIMFRFVPVAEYFTARHLRSMGVLMTGFLLLWLYMFWAQFFVSWYGNLPHEYGVISTQMYGHYAPVFWAMMACNTLIPLAGLIFVRVKTTWWMMIVVAAIINSGIWLNRYLLVMPGLTEDHRFFGSFTEITMTVGLFAGFLTVLLLFFNAIPAVLTWEKSDPADLGRIWK